jgi:ADP-ribosylation factor-binding protein GGA
MKSLAGANPDAKPDYRSQAMKELNKLESKVILLNEMLDNFDVVRGEKFASGDVYDVRQFLLVRLSRLRTHRNSKSPQY